MLKILIVSLITLNILFSYEVGDVISSNISTKLNLDSKKIYIIDFFASWCFSCKKEMPLISKLNSTVDKQRVSIIGIDVDEDISKARTFQEEMKKQNSLNYLVYNDPKGEIVSKFDPQGFPSIYIIKDLKVQKMIVGAKDSIDKIILNYIKDIK